MAISVRSSSISVKVRIPVQPREVTGTSLSVASGSAAQAGLTVVRGRFSVDRLASPPGFVTQHGLARGEAGQDDLRWCGMCGQRPVQDAGALAGMGGDVLGFGGVDVVALAHHGHGLGHLESHDHRPDEAVEVRIGGA